MIGVFKKVFTSPVFMALNGALLTIPMYFFFGIGWALAFLVSIFIVSERDVRVKNGSTEISVWLLVAGLLADAYALGAVTIFMVTMFTRH